MRVFLVRFLLPLAFLALIGGLGCKGDTPASLEPVGAMYGINIFNNPGIMRPGQVHMLGATGLYPGTATYNITALANWSSSDLNVIELIGKGIVHAVGGGTATIHCTYRGITSMSIMITVEGPPLPGTGGPEPVVLSQVQVEPTWAGVKIGDTVQFEAMAIYSNGATQPVTELADWRVSDDDPGFIIDGDNAVAWGATYGLFRATGPVGTTVVSCVYQDVVSNYVTVIVREY